MQENKGLLSKEKMLDTQCHIVLADFRIRFMLDILQHGLTEDQFDGDIPAKVYEIFTSKYEMEESVKKYIDKLYLKKFQTMSVRELLQDCLVIENRVLQSIVEKIVKQNGNEMECMIVLMGSRDREYVFQAIFDYFCRKI